MVEGERKCDWTCRDSGEERGWGRSQGCLECHTGRGPCRPEEEGAGLTAAVAVAVAAVVAVAVDSVVVSVLLTARSPHLRTPHVACPRKADAVAVDG